MTTVEKLELILKSSRLKPSSKDFVQSLIPQGRIHNLSDKQLTYVDKFWDECFPSQEILDEEKQWETNFLDIMKENTRIMGEYYRCHYPSSHFGKAALNPDYIPTAQIYLKNVGSQWAKKIIDNYNSEPTFKISDICGFRDTAKNRSFHKEDVRSNLLILDVKKDVKKDYQVFYTVVNVEKMEEQVQFEVRQDCLKAFKNKKKNEQNYLSHE